MVESGSNTDSDEKRDTVPELKVIKKDKGKKPIEAETGRMSTRHSKLQAEVDLITRKAKGIVIDEAKKPQTDMTAVTSKKGRRKKIVNIVRSSYSLRSGLKGMDVDLDNLKRKGKEKKTDETALEKVRKRMKRETLNAARKRKGKETETRDISGDEADTEEVCKRIRKGRNNDEDDTDKDGAAGSTGAYATRSSTRNIMLKTN